jgi:hypothetical protein
MGHSRPTTLAQVTTNTVGARTESSCPVSTCIIRRAYRVHAHTCVRWRATFVACPEIVRRLRLRERRPTCAHMGSEESTLQPGIVGTCANVEYRVSDAMRGPFSWSILLSIHISHLRCDRGAFVDRRVCSLCSSWSTQQVRLPTVAGGPLRQRRWPAVVTHRCRSRSHRSLHTFFSRLLMNTLY